jgi:hypothetical protein
MAILPLKSPAPRPGFATYLQYIWWYISNNRQNPSAGVIFSGKIFVPKKYFEVRSPFSGFEPPPMKQYMDVRNSTADSLLSHVCHVSSV